MAKKKKPSQGVGLDMSDCIIQGDVVLIRIPDLPAKCKEKANNHVAEGEVTGHYHEVVGKGVQVFEHDGQVSFEDLGVNEAALQKSGISEEQIRDFNETKKLFVRIPEGGEIKHQTHHTQQIPPGNYASYTVREYDHFAEQARNVAD